MRQLFLNKSNLVVKEVAQPLLHDTSILIAVHYAYVTQETDVSNFDTRDGFFNNVPHKVKRVLEAVASQALSSKARTVQQPHTAPGYSCSGRVISVGKKIKKFAPGDYVACIDPGYSPHSDLICVPEQCVVKLSHKENLKAASITTLAACALQALRRAEVQIGERVCIFGLDSVGLLAVQLAKLAGCIVVAVDTDPSRLERAEKMGAHATYCTTPETAREINLLTERQGIDASLITSSTESYFSYAMDVTREKGKLVLLKGGNSECNVLAWQKDIDILLSNDISGDYTCPYITFSEMRWTDNRNMMSCLKLIESGSIDTRDLIEREVTVKTLLPSMQEKETRALGGWVLAYEQHESLDGISYVSPRIELVPQESSASNRFFPAVSDTIRVGVLGADEFAQQVVLPQLASMKQVSVHALADSDISKAKYVANAFEIKQTFAKHEDLFKDSLIDVVVISSNHSLHTDHAIKAMKEGKAVLLEKPMATDFSQLQRIHAYLAKHTNVPFAVDYGLSFSPFAQKIKKQVEHRKTPLITHYRINRELTQHELRMQSSMGAGRIIGDTCQVIDLFCYLTEAQPVSISVEAMHAARDDIFPTDNVSIQISFSDGSVCSLLYTTLGNTGMGTDRLELFYDGKSILMEDYTHLYGFGLSSRFNETLTKPDRGYEAFMTHFFKALQQETYTPLIGLDRLHMVAEITLLIDKLACEGGGKQEM